MRIVLTGGGTGGHVIPNVAIMEELKDKHPECELLYIGSKNGPEKALVSNLGIPFEAIACGKLRRYLSFQNLLDAFKLPLGILQARKILKKFKPDKVFSKGGYVSTPVVIAAWSLRIPVIAHESDYSPGLANKISSRFADIICVSFEDSIKFFKRKDIAITGNPVRKSILNGDRKKGFEVTGFDDSKPVVLVMGGSLGAKEVNDLLLENLPEILKHCQVAHITGKGKGTLHSVRDKLKDYKQFEYLNEELAHVYAITDLVVSRAGANSLAEFAALSLPAILIPLSRKASRGDQIENAKVFEKEGMGICLNNHDDFAEMIIEVLENMHFFRHAKVDAASKIVSLLS